MTGALDDLFGALADPTRRYILQRLILEGPATATHLAVECPTSRDTPLTRQAIVKHLQVLVDASLATPVRRGREVHYTATPEPLAAVVSWLTDASPRWDRRLEKLRDRIEATTTATTSTP